MKFTFLFVAVASAARLQEPGDGSGPVTFNPWHKKMDEDSHAALTADNAAKETARKANIVATETDGENNRAAGFAKDPYDMVSYAQHH